MFLRVNSIFKEQITANKSRHLLLTKHLPTSELADAESSLPYRHRTPRAFETAPTDASKSSFSLELYRCRSNNGLRNQACDRRAARPGSLQN